MLRAPDLLLLLQVGLAGVPQDQVGQRVLRRGPAAHGAGPGEVHGPVSVHTDPAETVSAWEQPGVPEHLAAHGAGQVLLQSGSHGEEPQQTEARTFRRERF